MEFCIFCGNYVVEGDMVCWQCQQLLKEHKGIPLQQEKLVREHCDATMLLPNQ